MSSDSSRLGSAREEAERLVAAGLAAASMALHGVEANRQLRGLAEQMFSADRVHDLAAGLAGFVGGAGGHTPGSAGDGHAHRGAGDGHAHRGAGFATGTADCCVCPVCRLIAALRDPSPEFAERLASAAGDLAVGISGFLRVLSGTVPRPGRDADDDPWRAATAASTPTAAPDEPAAQASESAPTPAPAKATAKKATAKKTTAKKATPTKAAAGPATADQGAATRVPAKKAAAKKAVRKVVPRDADGSPA